MATVEEFLSLDVRIGTIISAERLRGARIPTLALRIDFGELGHRRASAAIADLYDPEDLVGLQVAAVVNLPPEEVAGFSSQARVLSVDNGKGERALLIPERPAPDGAKVG